MKTAVTAATIGGKPYDEDEFDRFADMMRARFAANVGEGKPVFTTGIPGLYEHFLERLPEDVRQVYNCNCCRQFVNTYGGLVTIDENGGTHSILWDFDAPALYRDAVAALKLKVERSLVTGVFLSNARTWGTAVTGDWHHLSVTPPKAMIHKDRVKTPGQVMAEKREDYGMLNRALADYNEATINAAVTLLKSETLYRSEKVLGVAEWLYALHMARKHAWSPAHERAGTWLAVATAPAGFCHVRSSMIGTLLDDLAAGKPIEEVRRAFAAKMHPLEYQRPTAPPKAGNIEQAEKLVEKLGIAPSLRRRYARLEDVTALWKPTVPPQHFDASGTVFGHLKAKPAPGMVIPGVQTMTWDKFRRTVLPDAKKIEVEVPSRGNFAQLVTAADMDAPPIIQWDLPEARNPVTWYLYSGGSPASSWGLSAHAMVECTAIALQPNLWGGEDKFSHHGKSVFLLLKGANDSSGRSLCLFPEQLKSELHAVRATVEAHSWSKSLEGKDAGSAAGLKLESHNTWNQKVRVTTANGTVTTYNLDRWD